MHTKAPSSLSAYASSSSDYAGLEFSHQFVKIVPRPEAGKPEVPPNHPSVYFGLLLHQHGKEAECKEFCETIKQEECERAAEAGRVMSSFGLRPPLNVAEEIVCPHLLLMTVSKVALGQEVTTYGLLASPGNSLLVRGLPTVCLTYRVVPMDDAILARAFVLPVEQQDCTPTQKSQHRPMWHALDSAVKEFYELFGGDHPCPDDSPVLARQQRAAAVTMLDDPRPPTAEERAITVALGAPLGCPAFCVGDVYNVLREAGDDGALCKFLFGAVAKHGGHCPVDRAFALSADSLNKMDRLVREHDDTVKTLKQKLDESELRVETLQNRLEGKRKREAEIKAKHEKDGDARPKPKASHKSVADVMIEMNKDDDDDNYQCEPDERETSKERKKNEQQQRQEGNAVVVHDHVSLEEMRLLLGAVGMTDNTERKVLKGNLRGGDVKGICRLLEDSLGADARVLEETTQTWAIAHFKEETARLGKPPPMDDAFAAIFTHAIAAMREHYAFEPGTEWTTPLLLWIGEHDNVATHVVLAGELQKRSAVEILRVDKNRTPIFYYRELERHLGFASEVEEAGE
jgi:hypothetical protein